MATVVYLGNARPWGVRGAVGGLVAVVVVLAIVIAQAVLYIRLENRAYLFAIGAVLAGSMLLFFMGGIYQRFLHRVTRQRGDRLFAQIVAYHADHHTWPESLGDLVPKYIGHLPGPMFGQSSFGYIHDESTGNPALTYDAPAGLTCTRDTNNPDWVCSD
jgi:hypothetical protein